MKEFADMCARHKRPGMKSWTSYTSIQPFLERLCDLGFLERREEHGTFVYYPTAQLHDWASWFQKADR